MVTTETLIPGPGSITWQINGEMILLLGWGRAILMQVAHPLVAEGVAHHSHFHTSPVAKVKRLDQTLNTMLKMTFNDREEALNAARGIDAIHGRVNGRLEKTTGLHYQAGTYYSARYPELLKWVHCTFVDSMIKTYELYVRKLTPQEKNRYLRETSVAAPMLGAPAGYFPTTTAELDQYMNEMLSSGYIVVGDRARALADYVLEPLAIPILGRLLRWYGILPVVGLMPENLRRGYNLRWGRLEAFTLKLSAWIYRVLIRPWLPAQFRRWPVARQAEKRAATQKR